jgi:O-antigen/teichoic acid export membrane protein
VNLGLCLALPLYRPVYEAWTGGTMAFDVELFAWLALAISLRCLGAPFSALIEGLNALRARVCSALAQSVLTLGCLALALPEHGLRAAGLAVAVGEMCGGVLVPVLSVWGLAPELMQRLSVRSLLLGAAPSLVVVASLLAAARDILSLPVVMGVALALGGLLYFLQWSELDPIMQDRLLALARIRRRPRRAD